MLELTHKQKSLPRIDLGSNFFHTVFIHQSSSFRRRSSSASSSFTAILTVVPVIHIFALVDAETVSFDIFIFAGIIVETILRHTILPFTAWWSRNQCVCPLCDLRRNSWLFVFQGGIYPLFLRWYHDANDDISWATSLPPSDSGRMLSSVGW